MSPDLISSPPLSKQHTHPHSLTTVAAPDDNWVLAPLKISPPCCLTELSSSRSFKSWGKRGRIRRDWIFSSCGRWKVPWRVGARGYGGFQIGIRPGRFVHGLGLRGTSRLWHVWTPAYSWISAPGWMHSSTVYQGHWIWIFNHTCMQVTKICSFSHFGKSKESLWSWKMICMSLKMMTWWCSHLFIICIKLIYTSALDADVWLHTQLMS